MINISKFKKPKIVIPAFLVAILVAIGVPAALFDSDDSNTPATTTTEAVSGSTAPETTEAVTSTTEAATGTTEAATTVAP